MKLAAPALMKWAAQYEPCAAPTHLLVSGAIYAVPPGPGMPAKRPRYSSEMLESRRLLAIHCLWAEATLAFHASACFHSLDYQIAFQALRDLGMTARISSV